MARSSPPVVHDLILLCGGKSSRMGMPKGLMPSGGTTWLERQIERFRALGGGRIVIVLGYEQEKYFKAIPWLRSGEDPGVSVVANLDPDHGPFTSILAGARGLDDSLFILPIDVPVPARAVWVSLSQALSGSVQAVVPSFEGRGGHPVLLSGTFLHRLTLVSVDSPDARLDRQIANLPEAARVLVPVRDPAILRNMNTLSDCAGSV
jgi:CTP:molybdopterin cytidylyltransferase MocA